MFLIWHVVYGCDDPFDENGPYLVELSLSYHEHRNLFLETLLYTSIHQIVGWKNLLGCKIQLRSLDLQNL